MRPSEQQDPVYYQQDWGDPKAEDRGAYNILHETFAGLCVLGCFPNIEPL